MSYLDTIRDLDTDPEQLETTYHQVIEMGDKEAFAAAVDGAYSDEPDNLLYAAWHYRLAYSLADRLDEWRIAWAWAIPLAIVNGLLLWWLSDFEQFSVQIAGADGSRGYNSIPSILLIWAPISASAVLTYLCVAGRRRWVHLVGVIAVLAILVAYVLLLYSRTGPVIFQEQYLILMIFHLPLAAWTAVGVYLLFGLPDAEERFAFLLKSLEVAVLAGLFAIAGMAFVGIAVALFDALRVQMSDLVMRLLLAGGGGLIPVLATAITYNPDATPAGQAFGSGLSRLIALLMRVMLPLTLALLVVYLAFIPMNFRAPFENREVLVSYNAMLFAVMVLLLGATPKRDRDAGGKAGVWLRRGIIALAMVAVLVSLYALSAILYRAWQDRLTPNRLTFIGWNVVNIVILLLILWKQVSKRGKSWLAALHSAFATGALLYVGWTLVVILALPWLFGISQGDVADLPVSVQSIVYERAEPILLKCPTSPHIYLLDAGEKRWVRDIPTFESQGFVWGDVSMIQCDDLRRIPDGPPIPPDAGDPPQP
jgi:hypothetical protein